MEIVNEDPLSNSLENPISTQSNLNDVSEPAEIQSWCLENFVPLKTKTRVIIRYRHLFSMHDLIECF